MLSLLLFAVSYADSPLPAPYYQYNVGGEIELQGGGDKANYTIVLLGKADRTQNGYEIINGMNKEDEKPVTLTNSNGTFYLSVNSPILFDSIKAAVLRTPEPIISAPAHYVNRTLLYSKKVTYEGKSESGCTSCATETVNTVIEKYIYNSYSTAVIAF
jgi:hypothetical protein